MSKFILLALIMSVGGSRVAAAPPMPREPLQLDFSFENGPRCKLIVIDNTDKIVCSHLPYTSLQALQ